MQEGDHKPENPIELDVNRVYEISLKKIRKDATQPRKYFDPEKLNELAESIKAEGLLQPITVVRDGNDGYLLLQGERRYRAHEILGRQTIRCIIVDSVKSLNNVRIVENTAREDLSDLELGREFQKRADAGETHEAIAKSIHKVRSFVTQRISLLKLPEEKQIQLEEGEISFTEARISAASDTTPPEDKVNGNMVTTVTMEKLEVYRLFKNFSEGKIEMGAFQNRPILDRLHTAYRKDLETIRRALA